MILYYILVLSLPLISQRFFAASVGGITVEKILGLVCLIYAIFYLFQRRGSPRILGTGQARAFLLFVLWATVSFFTLSRNATDPFGNTLTIYVSHLFFLITTLILVDSLYRLRWTILAAIGSVGWASLYMLREWQTGSAAYGADYRPGYVTGDPNYFTASVLICLPVAYYLLIGKQTRWERLFCFGCVFVTLPAIMVAASRGGFIGLMVAAVFVVLRSKQRGRNLILVSFGLLVVLVLSPSSPLQRLLHPTASDVESTDTRLELWHAGWKMVKAHPIMGVGLGNFKAEVASYAAPGLDLNNIAHNTYVEMAAELGVPGLLMFLAIIVLTFLSLGRSRRRALRNHSDLIYRVASGLQAGLAGFCISILFLSAAFLKLFWFAVFVSACLPGLLALAQRQQQAVAPLTGNQEVPSPNLDSEEQDHVWLSDEI